MRIGLIADIHGNLVALDAVLAALARESPDQLVCLGDVAALGPQPREVLARLRELACPVVLGNVDAWLLDPPPFRADDPDRQLFLDLTQWCLSQLIPEDIASLRAFPPTITIPFGNAGQLLCAHGSPRSFDDVIAATTPDAEIARMLAGQRADVLAGGHTHTQLLRRHGDTVIVNPGSVGLPGVNPGTPDLPLNRRVRWAEYAVLDLTDGHRRFDLRRMPLDLDAVFQAARASAMPHFDWWASKWDHP